MMRSSCLALAGLLALAACVPVGPPANAPAARMMLAQATPASDVPAPVDSAAFPPPPTPAPPFVSSSPASPMLNDVDGKPVETSAERHDRELGRTWGWTSVAIGASSMALALGTSVLMLEDNSTRNSNCNAQKVCNSSGITANGQLNDLGPWNAGFWVVGVVGLGVGIFLLATHPTDKSKNMQFEIAPTTSGANLQLRSTF